MNLPEFSVNRRVTISMFILIIVLGGIVSFFGLGLDLMPDLEFPILSVITRYEGVAPEEVENLITKHIEEVCSSIKGVKNIYSASFEGSSVVMAEFEWGTNLDFAAQDIRENIDMINMIMPTDAESSNVVKFAISQMPVLVYAVTGMKDTMQLRKYIKENVTPRLERIEGVAMAAAFGGLEREINVFVDKTKLQAYNLSMNEIIMTLARENINVSAGQVTKEYSEYLIRTLGEYKNLDAIRNTVLRRVKGVPIYIKDVAQVKDTHKEVRDITRLNGKDAVIMMISKQSGVNTVKMSNKVKKTIKEMKEKMSNDVEFYAVMDQADIIKKVLANTASNALVGAILAIVLIFFFLRNWRPTLGISLTIPISIIATFIGLYAFKYTFNIFTLGGLALVVGMLVDNAIVVIENTFRHLELGKGRKEAAKIGANEVGMAIATSTLTTIAVFLPMVLTTGLAGEISRPMAVTVCVGLIASLLVALTIVPMIASLLFQQKKKEEYAKAYGETKFEKVKDLYKRLLYKALAHKKRVILSALGAFILSILGLFGLGFEFMPKGDIPMMTMMARLPVGTDLKETLRVMNKVENEFMKLEEKRFVATIIGRSSHGDADAAMGTGPAGVNEGMIMLRLFDREERKKGSIEIIEELRAKLPNLRDTKFEFNDLASMMMSGGVQTPVEIKIFGKDLDELKIYGQEIVDKIKDVEGLRDINISTREGKPELQIRIDRDKAAYYGLSVGEIGETIQAASMGKVAMKYRVGGEETDVRIRFSEFDRDSIKDIETITIPTRAGFQIALSDVADFDYGKGPLKIERENRMRKVTITANTTGRAVGKVVDDIKQNLKDFKLPSGYFIEYGGTYKQMADTLTNFGLAFLAALFLIYMIMAAQFESFTQPFVIMCTVPLGIIGVIGGLLIMGMSFSTPAMMGVIILAGIAVNNGIIMIDYVNQLRKKGIEKHEALVEASATRLRPIFITAFTTILGVIPMAFSQSQGSEMRAPLGVAVGGGLLVSTMLTLFVIPVLYSIVDHIAYRAGKRITEKLHGKEGI